MSDTPVLVRQLRLQAGPGAPVQGLRARVEDALRISSKPPALAHAFVLLRRLRLRMPAGASAQSVALQLEASWRRLAAQALPIASAPDEAEAVWAADEAQARLALLQRWLQGAPASAWFWQRLLPAVSPSWPLALRLQALLCTPLTGTAAGREAEALQAIEQARLWRQAAPLLHAAGQLPALQAVLSPAQAAAWRAVVPADAPEALGAEPRGSVEEVFGDLRAVGRTAQATAPGAAAAAPTRGEAPVARHTNKAPDVVMPPGAAMPAMARRSRTQPSTPLLPVQRAVEAAAPQRHDASQPLPSPEPTAWAGLWFLLPMLRHAGLDGAPDAAPTFALLLRLLARRHRFDAPVARWIDDLIARTQADTGLTEQHAAATHWQHTLRLQALQTTRLPLRRVLHRPGRLLIAPHRVDVLLPLAQADIRLRRAGFDIDPGYLPWLDTIVHFHYLR